MVRCGEALRECSRQRVAVVVPKCGDAEPESSNHHVTANAQHAPLNAIAEAGALMESEFGPEVDLGGCEAKSTASSGAPMHKRSWSGDWPAWAGRMRSHESGCRAFLSMSQVEETVHAAVAQSECYRSTREVMWTIQPISSACWR